MSRCPSCGGILGRDCFNPVECSQITASMNDEQIVQPYIDALREALDTINQMADKMQIIDEGLSEHLGNLIDNTVAMINRTLPPVPWTAEQENSFYDDLPF